MSLRGFVVLFVCICSFGEHGSVGNLQGQRPASVSRACVARLPAGRRHCRVTVGSRLSGHALQRRQSNTKIATSAEVYSELETRTQGQPFPPHFAVFGAPAPYNMWQFFLGQGVEQRSSFVAITTTKFDPRPVVLAPNLTTYMYARRYCTFLNTMVERNTGSSLCRGTAAVTFLTIFVVYCCYSRKGSGSSNDFHVLFGKYDGSISGGRDNFFHARGLEQLPQDSLLDNVSVHHEKSRFLATAVNMTATKEAKEVGQEGFEGSDVLSQGSHREGGGSGGSNMEKVRDRCFVLEGEERTRCHPNIFFFGVSKCGTTSMAKWMTNHPQLRWVSRVKSSGKQTKPGQEARALQFRTKEEFASEYPFTAPEATEADHVIDCEL